MADRAETTPDHLRSTEIGGFCWMPVLAGSENGAVEIHESSVGESHICLRVQHELDPETAVHLPTATARLLAEQMVHMADHVEQGRFADG